MVEVSVIIPFYGEHEGRHSLPAVTAAWLAQDVACEVVVATAGEVGVSVAPDRDAQRRARVVVADPGARAPGILRNVGSAEARGAWFYLSDSDVAPLGAQYLRRALDLIAGDGVFCQPWMYRTFDPGAVPAPVHGAGEFCFVRTERDGALVPHGGERIVRKPLGRDVLRAPTPMVQPPAQGRDPRLTDDLQWRAPFHWGGLLVRRELFEAVGGYCEAYSGWGCEDDDLLIKIAAHRPPVRGWQADPSLSCLHFEHPRPYFGTAEQAGNRALFLQRVAAGPCTMAEEDGLRTLRAD